MQTLDVTIDLETYFDAQYSLTKKTATTMDYVRDPRFELQGMSIKIGGGRTRYYDTTEAIQKQIANLKKLQKTHKINLIGQNTKFDALVLNERLGFTPDYYSDTQAMSKGLWPHYPSNLEAIAKRLWPNDKEKHKLDGLTAVKGVRRKDFTRDMRHKLGVYCVRDSDITYQAHEIMKQWMPKSELDVINMTVRMFVEPQFVLDTRLMQQVIEQAKTEESVAVKMMQEAHPNYPVTRQTFTSNQQFINFLKHLGINDSEIPTKISPRTGKVTPALGKSDVPFIKFKNDNIHLAKIFQTREFLKSSISRTRAQKLIQAVEHHPEKKLCVPLAYYQAHTGRYGGNEGLNLQNLQRKSHHRLALTAPEGSFVYVIDSSNIEARMLAWFANEHGLLDQFRNKEDVYSTLASKIYDIEVTKQTHPGERGVGKVAQLGLGYQMGAPKFFDTLRSGPMGMDPIDCDFDFAERVVKTFRNTYPNIVRSWKTGQHVITKMTRGGMEEPWGPLMIYERALMLPNGMCLHYPELSVTEIETVTGVSYEYNYKTYDFKSKKFVDRKIYGGKLIENIVQALARIVIIDQMLRIDAMLKEYGGRVVLQVHDEIIAIAPKEKADEIFAKMTAIMSTPPAWCHDLPLDSEGGFDTCYSK